MNNHKSIHQKPPTWIVVSYVVADESSVTAKRILEDQLSIFIGSYRQLEEDLGLYIYTNSRAGVAKVVQQMKLRGNHMHVQEVLEQELTFCLGLEGEHFQYAFSKLNALKAAEENFRNCVEVKQIILSDIDCYLSRARPLVTEELGNDILQAIDYRSEQSTTVAFDRLMTKIGMEIGCQRKEYKAGEAAWINSGMVVIPTKLLRSVCEKTMKGMKYMRQNKESIKASCAGHYGDEILLSAIFNSTNNRRIPLTKNKVAQLIWTCKTVNPTFHWIDIVDPPAHLHLPAIKFMESQRNALRKMANAKVWKNGRIALVLNSYSIEERYINGIRRKPIRFLLKLSIQAMRFAGVSLI